MQLLEQRKPSETVIKIIGAIMVMTPIIVLFFVEVPVGAMVLLLLLTITFIWFMLKSSMNVWLGKDELVLQMAPFPKQYVPFKSIMAIHEHMAYPWAIGKRGWGYKKSPGVTVYFAGAGPGVVIELKNKKAIWLSTSKGDLISRAVR
jgi:hypothetical protein